MYSTRNCCPTATALGAEALNVTSGLVAAVAPAVDLADLAADPAEEAVAAGPDSDLCSDPDSVVADPAVAVDPGSGPDSHLAAVATTSEPGKDCIEPHHQLDYYAMNA